MNVPNAVFALLSTLFLALGVPAETRTYYLDSGRGTSEGVGTEDAPFWTFDRALAAAELASETNIVIYVDCSTNNHQIFLDGGLVFDIPGKNLTLLPWRTSISGDFNVILDGQGAYCCVCGYDPGMATLRNFTLRNGFSEQFGGGAHCVTLVDSVITNCSSGGVGGGVNNCVLQNCRIVDCSAEELGGGAAFSKLYNCLVLRNRAPYGGGAYHCSAYSCTFDGNTAATCGGFAFCTDEKEDEGLALVNSIILDNGTDNWKSDNTNDVVCRVFTDGDPKFVDPAHDDYRLRADSPCIDSCIFQPEDMPAVDLAGNPRLRGAALDLGCYEFQRHAAFMPGTLDVSINAQVMGAVLYAQGPWTISVDEAARSWLSADVTSGSVSNSIRFTFAANATHADRSTVVSVFTNGSAAAVQQVMVRQVGSATDCAGRRRGIFVGCAHYEYDPKTGTNWLDDTGGGDFDSVFYRDLWCRPADLDDTKVCRLLTNECASAANVESAFETILAELQPNDEFMLSVSGHGDTSVPGWEHVLWSLYPIDENLPFATISNMLIRAASKCAKVICCIDACNAAGAYKFADQFTCDGEIIDRRSMPQLLAATRTSSPAEPYLPYPNIAFIVASDYDQYANSGELNGQFTGALKYGYETGAADADGDGVLNMHELYRYAYLTGSIEDQTNSEEFVQGRCYNRPLLLKTIVRTTGKVGKPSLPNPLNPHYVDFVNWVQRGSLVELDNPHSAACVATAVEEAGNCVSLEDGTALSLVDAFTIGYAPVLEDVINEPFKVSLAVTNGTPYLSWTPDRSQDAARLRTYTIRAKSSLTNETWTTFPADVAPEQLRPYSFFQVDVTLRQ